MSFDITPTGPVTPGEQQRSAPAAAETTGAASDFSRIYELQEARARRAADIPPMAGDSIPDEVWDEVDKASALYDKLATQGRRMVFDNDRLTGRVVASLLSSDGSSESVPLTDVVDFSSTP